MENKQYTVEIQYRGIKFGIGVRLDDQDMREDNHKLEAMLKAEDVLADLIAKDNPTEYNNARLSFEILSVKERS